MYKGCFVGYPSEYFNDFFSALENTVDCYFVTQLKSDFEFLSGESQKVDVSYSSFKLREEVLLDIEPDDFYDILLRDRYFSRLKNPDLDYYRWCYQKLVHFFEHFEIDYLFTWRDTAVQILAIRAAQKVGVKVRIATRMRLPKERIFFTNDIETSSIVKRVFGTTMDVDIEGLLAIRPEWKVSTRNFIDVIRILPLHFRVFNGYLNRLRKDFGNRYNRYSIIEIIFKYLLRRLRLLRFKFCANSLFSPVTGNYIYFGLHTQPESSIDIQGKDHYNQLEFVKKLRMHTPSNLNIVVKIHPTDVDGKPLEYFRKFSEMPGVTLLNHHVDSQQLILNSEAVVTITGTAGIEAVCLKKSVYTFAPNYYNMYEGVHYCESWSAYHNMVRSKEETVDWNANSRIIKDFVSHTFSGEVSRAYGANPKRLSPQDIQTIVRVYSGFK